MGQRMGGILLGGLMLMAFAAALAIRRIAPARKGSDVAQDAAHDPLAQPLDPVAWMMATAQTQHQDHAQAAASPDAAAAICHDNSGGGAGPSDSAAVTAVDCSAPTDGGGAAGF